jgi:hypothetical protein
MSETLDDASELASAVAAPWAGLLWLASAPLRLVQAHFVARLLELGPDARAYGDHLHGLALAAGAALLVSLYGRAVFTRACRLQLRSRETPGREALRIPPAAFAGYVYAALAIEAAFFATLLAFVTAPVLVIVAGLAAATSPELERPGLLRPFAVIAASARHVGPLVGLLAVFTIAALLATVNLFALVEVGLWLAGGVAGLDIVAWQAVLAPGNPRLWLVLFAGGVLLVEPWWLASLVVFAHERRARASGADLRLWFDRLRSAAS